MAEQPTIEQNEQQQQGFSFERFHDCLTKANNPKTEITIGAIQELMVIIAEVVTLLGGSALDFVKNDINLKHSQVKAAVGQRKQTSQEKGEPTEGPEFDFHYANTAMELEKKDSEAKPYSNALLRQRRTIHFVCELLTRMQMNPQASLSTCCSEAYNTTLYEVHPWVVRAAVKVAVYALPAKNTFLALMQINPEEEEEKLELLVSPMRNLVDALWTMFDDHGLGDWK